MDKNINAKKRKILKLLGIAIAVFIGISGVMIIIALATSSSENINEIIFFAIGAFFLGFALIAFFVYFKLLKSRWYAQHQLDSRLENFEEYKKQNEIPVFNIPFNGEFNKEKFDVLFDSLLHDFTKDDLGGGALYYTLGANVFNKTKNSIDAFYVVPQSVKNTLGLVSEKFAIKVYIKQVEEYLATKFDDSQFINCVIVFLHDELSDKGKNFYYNFAGENSFLTANNGAFIKNKFYNYVGILKDDLSAYFYFPLNTDTEATADLDHLIKEFLLAEREKIDNNITSEDVEKAFEANQQFGTEVKQAEDSDPFDPA